jgi:hypothetical protein
MVDVVEGEELSLVSPPLARRAWSARLVAGSSDSGAPTQAHVRQRYLPAALHPPREGIQEW